MSTHQNESLFELINTTWTGHTHPATAASVLRIHTVRRIGLLFVLMINVYRSLVLAHQCHDNRKIFVYCKLVNNLWLVRWNFLFFCQQILQYVFLEVCTQQDLKLITSNENLDSVIISDYIKRENIKCWQWDAAQLTKAELLVRFACLVLQTKSALSNFGCTFYFCCEWGQEGKGG